MILHNIQLNEHILLDSKQVNSEPTFKMHSNT